MTKTRVRVAGAVGVVLLASLLVAWSYFAVRVSTDDAQIDGHVNTVSARVGGTVTEVLVADNQFVEKGTPLVRIEARHYEIAVARAAADLAENEAQARAAHTNVPMTSTMSTSQEAASASDLEGAEARLVSSRARAREAAAKVTKSAQDLARLKPLLATLGTGESPAACASGIEFVLEGLHLTKRLNKDALGGRATYRGRG